MVTVSQTGIQIKGGSHITSLAEANMVQSLIGWSVVKGTGCPWRTTFQTSYWKLLRIQRCISDVSDAFLRLFSVIFPLKILFLHMQESASLSGPWGGHICRTEQTCTHRLSSHALLCRRKWWGVEIYSDCLALRSSLTRFMSRSRAEAEQTSECERFIVQVAHRASFYDARVSAALFRLLLGRRISFAWQRCCLSWLTDWEARQEQNMSLELLCVFVFPYMYLGVKRDF